MRIHIDNGLSGTIWGDLVKPDSISLVAGSIHVVSPDATTESGVSEDSIAVLEVDAREKNGDRRPAYIALHLSARQARDLAMVLTMMADRG